MNVRRLTNTRSAVGRHLARAETTVREAELLHGRQREAVLRGAARDYMRAGFHYLARDVRRQAREVQR